MYHSIVVKRIHEALMTMIEGYYPILEVITICRRLLIRFQAKTMCFEVLYPL